MCMYFGSDVDIPKGDPLGMSGAVVKLLMEKYLGKGHILYTDNWYTSPALAKFLVDHDTGAVGTVHEKRKNMPNFQATKRGDIQKHKCDEILVIRWHDKREVHLLSTVHSGKMEYSGKTSWKTKEKIMKPDVVNDYNENMRLIDKSDMQITSVDCLRKTRKWTRKVVFHLIDACLLNAYNTYMVKIGERTLLRLFNKKVAT